MSSYLNILAVDDDKISQKMIGRALADEAFSVSYADNGADGLQKAQDETPRPDHSRCRDAGHERLRGLREAARQ